jgi:hypothetical protein
MNEQKALKSILENVSSKISLTCDGWTSPGNHSVLGVTAHWIEKYELKSMILAAKLINGPHSGVNLAAHLHEVLQTFGISKKIFCIMADNTSNNTTMAAELNSLIGFNHQSCMLGCMPHVINLAAKAGISAFSGPAPKVNAPRTLSGILSDPPAHFDISNLISRISKLATYLKQSTQKAAAFTELSSALTGKPLKMISDVPTQWNSTFAMLERAYKLRETIQIFCERNSLSDKYSLSEAEWKKVKQMCDFLKPPNQATNKMSTNKHVLVMLAAPAYFWLMERLQDVSCLSFPFL